MAKYASNTKTRYAVSALRSPFYASKQTDRRLRAKESPLSVATETATYAIVMVPSDLLCAVKAVVAKT